MPKKAGKNRRRIDKTTLTQSDINAIAEALAPRLVEQVREGHHEFWIDPKNHYDEHMGLRDMLSEYTKAKGIFWHTFIYVLAAGAVVVAGIGTIKGWFIK